MRNRKDEPKGYMISAGNTVGNLFFGSKGYMAKDVNQWRTYMDKDRQPGPTGRGLGNHYANFVNAIRQADTKTYNKNIQEGFYTCALIHLANISYRLGRSLDFDPQKMRFTNDKQANRMLRREYRKPYVVPEKV